MSQSATDFKNTRSAGRFAFLPTLGDLYFVDSANGNANNGQQPDARCLTLAQAIALCTDAKGDQIYINSGHAESFVAAAALTINKGNILIQGLGAGRARPTFTWSTLTSAQMIISSANVTIRNCVFDFTGVSAIVAAISITGADVAFEDCEFIISTGTNAPVLGILTAATASRLRFTRCRFLGAATSTDTCTACIKHEVGADYVIEDCYFCGKLTQAILNATALLRGRIHGNTFVIGTGTVAITMHASSTPMITNNRINVASGTAPIVAAAGFVSGNNYSAAAGVTAGTASTI